MNKTKRWNYSLLLTGILLGALIFSQWHPATRPELNAEPLQTSTQPAVQDRPIRTLSDLNDSFVEIAETVNPTVVTVFTEKVLKVKAGYANPFFFNGPFQDFFGGFFGQQPQENGEPKEQEYRQEGLGSGVIVSEDGYILTNNHVVQDADTIQVRFMDEKTLPAKVVGTDAKTDIAVLKVKGDNLPAIRFGDSDVLRVGEWVLAIGSPMSANLAHSVTSGIVSAKGRSNVGLADYEDFIQTDAAINPGNSGGALVNLKGELVGINTAIATRSGGFQGIGFAVPINMARNVMESLIEHGTVIRGWLGVYIQDIDENMAKAMDLPGTKGVLVADVQEDSPADKAGIKQGDVITGLNGEKMVNSTQLRNKVASTSPEQKVVIELLRDGKQKTVSVVLGKLEADQVAPKTEEKLEELFGFNVAPLDQSLADKYHLDKKQKGVVITGIQPGSSAQRAGVREGDLIIAMNRKKIETAEAFDTAAKKISKGDMVLLQIIRQNRNLYLAFTL